MNVLQSLDSTQTHESRKRFVAAAFSSTSVSNLYLNIYQIKKFDTDLL